MKRVLAVAPFDKGGGDRAADAGDLLLLLLLEKRGANLHWLSG
ncbi:MULTISPECIES: hypothetical protein [Lysobacter]|nr:MULTISPECIES: hypothetical protein [Lysobacter]